MVSPWINLLLDLLSDWIQNWLDSVNNSLTQLERLSLLWRRRFKKESSCYYQCTIRLQFTLQIFMILLSVCKKRVLFRCVLHPDLCSISRQCILSNFDLFLEYNFNVIWTYTGYCAVEESQNPFVLETPTFTLGGSCWISNPECSFWHNSWTSWSYAKTLVHRRQGCFWGQSYSSTKQCL